jgi:LmbE family N-acetylglucosaminyl deacetylase
LSFRLLCVVAHPDDESIGFGGALLKAHRDGVETNLLCLTDGQAARNRGDAKDGSELGHIRRAELADAATVLGLTSYEVLDYPDGELLRQDFYAFTGEIVKRIRSLRPHVVLTFGGDGAANLHRDHTMTCMVTTAAFHWAARAIYFPEQLEQGIKLYMPQKLYYLSSPFVRVSKEAEAPDTPMIPYSLSLELGDLLEQKMIAFRKHASQVAIFDHVDPALLKRLTSERYLLAAAPGLISIDQDKGLFDGVRAD